MPFGLFNVLTSFQGYINKILAKKLNVFIIVYLDNILIYIKDAGQAHINAVQKIFEKLRKHSFFANLKNCRFHKDEFCFLRHIPSVQGVQMKEKRIKIVKNWLAPKLR